MPRAYFGSPDQTEVADTAAAADERAPRLSLTIAVVLTLVTVVGIIAHLDHLARRL